MENPQEVSMEQLLADTQPAAEATAPVSLEDSQLRAVMEAIVYVAEDPLTPAQIAAAVGQPVDRVSEILDQLIAEFEKPEHGVSIRAVAGGFKMATKAEHHDTVRSFAKSLKPPLKLSLPALETLAVIAYKQPVTGPEIMAIRGVQGLGVLKTLLDRRLIAAAGRKNVVGKPILYKTTRDFLVQFGLMDLGELPSLKEGEEIWRLSLTDGDQAAAEAQAAGAEAATPDRAPHEPGPHEPDPDEPIPAEPLPDDPPEAQAPEPPVAVGPVSERES